MPRWPSAWRWSIACAARSSATSSSCSISRKSPSRPGASPSVEALLRWQDPARGLVAPGLFLPTLESTGLIVPVGEWALAQAAADSRRWSSMGFPPVRVAVNAAPMQLSRRDFASKVLDASLGPRSRAGLGTRRRDHRKRAARRFVLERSHAARAAQCRRAHRDRRLRHGLFLAQPPVAAAGRHAEDRSQLHQSPAGGRRRAARWCRPSSGSRALST